MKTKNDLYYNDYLNLNSFSLIKHFLNIFTIILDIKGWKTEMVIILIMNKNNSAEFFLLGHKQKKESS